MDGYRNDEGDEQGTGDYRLCPAVNQDASLCSMGSASQSDDWCGECIRRRPERLSMSPAVDAGAIIVSELGTSVPWHVEDNCKSDASIAIIHVDRPCKATRLCMVFRGSFNHLLFGAAKIWYLAPPDFEAKLTAKLGTQTPAQLFTKTLFTKLSEQS